MNRFFAPGGEFSGIERMFDPSRFARDGQGLGDDAFVWSPGPGETWVASTDASVAGVHFRTDWVSRPEALRKALLSNLSDINAMGGRTRFALFALGASPAYDNATFEALGTALRALEEEHGFRIVGGDTTRSGDAEFFNFTVMGVVEGRPLLRSGARPGHKVYVSGTLGGSAAGLALFRNPHRPPPDPARAAAEDALKRAHVVPQPPLALGPALAALNGSASTARAIAAIDLSDGLSSELWHLARQSGCALTIDFEKLPAHPALASQPPALAREHMLHGGEEYQLIFTGEFSGEELARLRTLAAVTEIGAVAAGEGVYLTEAGVTAPLPAGGFVHEA
jgi:thiamine-monophosphate kinase